MAVAVQLSCTLLGPAGSGAAATPAGTRIVNVAGLHYTADGQVARVSSNAVTLTVAELLDVAVSMPIETISAEFAEKEVAVAFAVANLGNAAETFLVAANVDGAIGTIVGLAADTDGNGTYDIAIDQVLTAASLTLAAGQRQRVFALVRGAAATEPITVTATATAATGHGEPGTVVTAAGDGGGDAVVGRTGAKATASARIVSGKVAAPSLVKSQAVVAPDGSARVVAGSRVTYSLEARFPGPMVDAQITDPLPAGTLFVAGSLKVGGRAVSDAVDDDAGAFDGTAIRVNLGDIAVASARSVQFTVQIQ